MVGHVTRDEVAGGVHLGGTASYAALAAACLGYETALVTIAPPDDPLLEPLRRAPRLHLHCVPSEVMTTFALDYAGGQRRLWLRRRARPLVIDDVPVDWRRPRIAYVGAVAGELDAGFAQGLGGRFVGAAVQGWLRRFGDDGRVEPAHAEGVLEVRDPPGLHVAIVSEEDHPDAETVVRGFVGNGGTAAITRGRARGATLLRNDARLDIPALPAREVDPTGAGDVFGVVLTLELAPGKTARGRGARRRGGRGARRRGSGAGDAARVGRLRVTDAVGVGVPVDLGAVVDDLEVGHCERRERAVVRDAERAPLRGGEAIRRDVQRDVAAVGEEHAVLLERVRDHLRARRQRAGVEGGARRKRTP